MVDMSMIDNSPYHSNGYMFETLYQSGIYWKFIGISQLLSPFLLMTQRFATLGAVVFFPIILNIFIITTSYDFQGTTYITALMLLANIALLVWDWPKLKILLNFPMNNYQTNPNLVNKKLWEVCGLALFIFTATWRSFINSFRDVLIWILISLLIGLVTLFLAFRKKKNDTAK